MRLSSIAVLSLSLLAGVITQPGNGPTNGITPDEVGGEKRLMLHVSTDKPIYRAGETLYARGVALDAFDHRPVEDVGWTPVEVLGPKGEVVASSAGSPQDGVVAFTWVVPDGAAGGNYRLRMGGGAQVAGERAFEVRAFRAPRIKTQIVFVRDGYGPGDEVVATLSATRAEGGAPTGARVTLVAMVDGTEIVHEPVGTIDAAGRATARFHLPKSMERGDGTIALVVEDGGVVETATKTIPILLATVDMELYPEGGDLVAGIPARIYLEARTPADKPADVAGTIETRAGVVVASFRTEHEGRGRVRLEPVAGEQYLVRVTQPTGITKTWNLPIVALKGGTISTFDDVSPARKPVRVRLAATASGEYVVSLSLREREVASRRVELLKGDLRSVALDVADDVSGVLRVTLSDAEGRPISERLVFRQPAEAVNVSITTDRPRYVPAGTVRLTVKTTRADGTPVRSVVGLSVSDDTVRELLETRDQPPQLPVQVLLEGDVRELADAAVYLSPTDPKAPRAVDLLLGTQGWRRFAWSNDVSAFLSEHGDDARRALAYVEQPLPASVVALAMTGAAAPEADGVEGGVVGGIVGGVIGGAKRLFKADDRAFEVARENEAVAQLAAPVPAPPAAPKAAWRQEPMRIAAEEKLQKKERADGPVVAPRDKDARANGMAFAEPQLVGRLRVAAAGDAVEPMEERAFDDERMQSFAVREYAHVVRTGRVPGDRVDFTDTVYWNAGVKTDDDGEATVTFELSDSVTSFRVLGDAFTGGGALGTGTILVDSVEPFYLEPKMPLEVSSGDRIRLPIATVNGTIGRLSDVSLTASASGLLTFSKLPTFSLADGERGRSFLDVVVGSSSGVSDLTIAGRAGDFHDSVTRTLRVAPLGFPASLSFGGMIGPNGRVTHELVIPKDVVPSSVHADVKVFASSLGKLTSALERLITEPYGCFEQTSSTTYPLVMAAQYFESHDGVDPALITRSQEMLGKGYEKLTGFECKTKGYEWFGESPGHEALSAFGLLEFTDMSRVRSVDAEMVRRTRDFVLATRDGKGGFKRERRALHTWIEDVDCSNAYITWALLEAGESAKTLGPEIDAVAKAAGVSTNSYVQALAANVLQLAGRTDDANRMLVRLAGKQAGTGALEGATASIVGSGGDDLSIEATSFATLAWLKSPAHQANAEKAIRYLADSCQGGRYGSTQSTVLALRAIVAYDEARRKPTAAGTLQLVVDGKPFGEAIAFDETTGSAITFPDAGAALTAGSHRLEIAMTGGSEMPHAVEVKFNHTTPDSSPDRKLDLRVEISDDRFVEGEVGEAIVRIDSRSSEPLPMAVAIVGLPGGLEPRHEQLKELVRSKAVSAYEVIGREVVLYFRSLEPDARLRIPLSLVASVPGTYRGPASRAYLYYDDAAKAWSPGFTAEIAAR